MRQQCAVIANKADFIVGYMRRMVGNRIGKVVIPLLNGDEVVPRILCPVCVTVHLLFPPSFEKM